MRPGSTTSLTSLALVLAVGALPARALAEPLTLEQALTLARQSAPRRAAAAAIASGAETAAQTAGRLPNPSLELITENWRPGGGDNPREDYYALLSMPLELGGKRGARRDLARAEAGVAAEDLRAIGQRVELAVAERYVAALHARGVAGAAREQREGASEVLRILRRRVSEGNTPGSDLAKLEAELARLETATVRADLDARRATAELAATLGPEVRLAPDDLVEPAPLTPPARARDASEGDALARRPDVARARARAQRAEQQLVLERAQAVPDVTLAGGWKRVEDVDTGVFGLSVPLPISDRNQGAIALAGGEAEAASRELAAVEAEARADVEASLVAATALAEQARRIQQDLVEPAEIVLRAARSRFREGGSDVLALVDAERVAIEARREALDLHLDAALAALRARAALAQELVAP